MSGILEEIFENGLPIQRWGTEVGAQAPYQGRLRVTYGSIQRR